MQAQVPIDTQGVRTRVGRVVKKVGRLIESLAQKPFLVQGVKSKVRVKSKEVRFTHFLVLRKDEVLQKEIYNVYDVNFTV